MLIQQVHRPLCTPKALDVLDLVEPAEQRIEVAQFGQHSTGRFLTDARDARYVVGRIALERLDLGHILRTEAVVPVGNGLGIVNLYFTKSGVHHQRGLVIDQLQLIGIAGQDQRFYPLVGRLF